MNTAGLNYILQNSACKGAFKVDGAALTPLSAVDKTVEKGAYRTRNLWGSLVPVVSDAGMMIASRGSDQSIASARGGLIVEANKPLNLGILKSAVNHQDLVEPNVDFDRQADLCRGYIALWNLAEWISTIETSRCLRVHLGAKSLDLLASKGRFFPLGDLTVGAVMTKINSAARGKGPIELGYAELPNNPSACTLNPLSLLKVDQNSDGNWRFNSKGLPISIPNTASFTELRKFSTLARQLTNWRQGDPFELAVIRASGFKEVIASSDTADEINVKTPTE